MLLSQVGLCAAKAPEWSAGGRKPDPATVLPLEQIAEQHRGNVADVIRNHTLHRRGAPDTFPANPRIYLALLEQPVLTLSLWKDVGESPARLQQTGPGRFVGSDGSGTSASWEYLIKSPRLHVMLCELDYVSPRGAARLTGRIVLILRTGYFKETGGESWIRHEVEAFVKVDSTAWKALAVTLRPIVESVLEDQVQEAGLFISLMARLVETYPDWATGVAQQAYLPADAKKSFGEIVKQTRRPGAFTTRPMMADGRSSDSPARRR
jgi:hypothetical protein